MILVSKFFEGIITGCRSYASPARWGFNLQFMLVRYNTTHAQAMGNYTPGSPFYGGIDELWFG